MGKSYGNFHFKKLSSQHVFLADKHVVAMDTLRNIYRYEIGNHEANLKQADKRVAFEIYAKPNTFIELQPTEQIFGGMSLHPVT